MNTFGDWCGDPDIDAQLTPEKRTIQKRTTSQRFPTICLVKNK